MLGSLTQCTVQDRFEEVKSMLQPFLKTSGFRDAQVSWLPAVGPSGENLVRPPAEPALAGWWHGCTVLQTVDAFKPGARDVNKPLRLPVTDVFKSARGGAALGGRLAGGALKVPASKPSACNALVWRHNSNAAQDAKRHLKIDAVHTGSV